MTTIFGIKHPDVESGILVADRQTTIGDRRTGLLEGKHLGRKIWINKDNLYCVGHSGLRNKETEEFIENLVEGKYDIEKIVKKKYFPELRKLNIKRMGNHLPNLNDLSSFLLLSRFNNEPRLYTCFPLGSVEERVWTSIGSGYSRVQEYMDAIRVLSESKNYNANNSPVTLPDILQIGLEAVRRSGNQDIYSNGLDLVVCTPDKIMDHFNDFGDNFGKKLEDIKNAYSSHKNVNHTN